MQNLHMRLSVRGDDGRKIHIKAMISQCMWQKRDAPSERIILVYDNRMFAKHVFYYI